MAKSTPLSGHDQVTAFIKKLEPTLGQTAEAIRQIMLNPSCETDYRINGLKMTGKQ